MNFTRLFLQASKAKQRVQSIRKSPHILNNLAWVAGILFFNAAPVCALEGTDAALKDVIVTVEKQTRQNIPRTVSFVGLGAVTAYCLWKGEMSRMGMALGAVLGSAGMYTYVDKSFAATLDHPEAIEFLMKDADRKSSFLLKTPQHPASSSSSKA